MATNFHVEIDKKLLMAEIMASKKAMSFAIRKSIGPIFDREQQELVKEFVEHPITREIQGGASAYNQSSTMGGYGNLFTFLGFRSGSTPVDVIEAIFSQKMKFQVRSLSATGRFRITLQIPDVQTVFKKTPLPWAKGLSWAEGIETGISNLGHYLYTKKDKSHSRSKRGLQTKADKGRSFTPQPYVSGLIKDFKDKLKKGIK